MSFYNLFNNLAICNHFFGYFGDLPDLKPKILGMQENQHLECLPEETYNFLKLIIDF